MRKTAVILTFLLVSFMAYGMTPVRDKAAFEKKLAAEVSSVKSIDSRFVQEKYIDIFSETVSSGGYFKFMNGKVRLEYSSPVDYLIIVNGGMIKIVSGGKETVMDASGNPMIGQIGEMITACMTGNISALASEFSLDYYEDASSYELVAIPADAVLKSYIRRIEILLDKNDFSVDSLKMYESETDYTLYRFTGKKFNTLDDEGVFRIR